MKLNDKLRDTDQRLVPRLASRLRAVVDGAAERRRGAVDAIARPAPGPLRRLDDRYAARGPLVLLREVPQVGLLAIALVFLAGTGAALSLSDERTGGTAAQQGATELEPTSLGPPIGTPIDAYIAGTRTRATQLSEESPDAEYTALVAFRTYLTPEQARVTLGDLDVAKVVLRAQLPTAEVLPIAVQNLVPEVRAFYRELARRKTAEAAEFAGLASSIDGQSKEEQQFKAFYVAAAGSARKEAKAYSGSCPCVIGALVRGRARDLAALPAVKVIRVVEIGGQRPDEGVVLQPLLPEQKGVVTKAQPPTTGG